MATVTQRRLAVLLIAGGVAVAGLTPAEAATKHRASRPSSCVIGAPPFASTPAEITSPLDPSITASFAFLRRSAGPADVLSPLNPFGQQLDFDLRAYYPAYIRQLAQDPDGQRYFLIPGLMRIFALPPAHCLPRSLRSRRPQLIAEQRRLSGQPVYCIASSGPHSPPYGGASCQPFASIQTGVSYAANALSTNEVNDIVPDGVATVRIAYRSGDVINAPVSGNFYSYTPPQRPIRRAMALLQRAGRALGRKGLSPRQRTSGQRSFSRFVQTTVSRLTPRDVQWLDAGGHAIRHFKPRLPAANAFALSVIG